MKIGDFGLPKTMTLKGGLHMYGTFDDSHRREGDTMCAGRKVVFLNINGYDSQLSRARTIFLEGQVLEVEEIHIGRSNSKVKFKGIDKWFNTVMFQDYEDYYEEV